MSEKDDKFDYSKIDNNFLDISIDFFKTYSFIEYVNGNLKSKDIFKKLGFNSITTKENIRYLNRQDNIYITFFKDKTYSCTDLNGEIIFINISVHKAINKQMKELGWIK